MSAGSFVGYVYSSDPYAYGTSDGEYYYDSKTTISSPTQPSGITYPEAIISPTVNVSWKAASSLVPDYSVASYELSYSINGGSSWTVVGTTSGTSMDVTVPAGATSIQFRVRSKDSNNQWSTYGTGQTAQILLHPTLSAPNFAMQGQNITVSWTSITGASSYTLQRKANTDNDWVQVYSGAALTFTEAAGAWESVQYRVQAAFAGGTGGWETSNAIPVASASTLVINGQDGDLGTIVDDVQYSVMTDTGNNISLTITVNGIQVENTTLGTSVDSCIPVMDLPTGTGTIVITATVTATGGPVTVKRSWTYTKAAQRFPDGGGVLQARKGGKNVFPMTLAELVRTPAFLGGNLGLTLEKLAPFISAGARVATGSYQGTGAYGADSPSEFVAGFPVKFGFIATSTGSCLAIPQGESFKDFTTAYIKAGFCTTGMSRSTKNGLEWYGSSPEVQMNLPGTAYYIVVFG